jgi:DNA helicase IV
MPSPLDSLNPDQRTAATSEASRLLVLAGAGSGKTLVLIRKILHLVLERGVDPSGVLAVTFTRNAANQMKERLVQQAGEIAGEAAAKKMERATVRTFHSLGFYLLRTHWRKLFDKPVQLVTDSPSTANENDEEPRPTKGQLLRKAIDSLYPDPAFRVEFKRHLWDYVTVSDENDRFGIGVDPRKRKFVTLAGEGVRSYAEREVANLLHDLGISYRYDQTTQWGGVAFRPDFHLPEQDTYLEIWEFAPGGGRTERESRLAAYNKQGAKLIEIWREELLDFPRLVRRLGGELAGAFDSIDQPHDLARLDSERAGYPEAIASFLDLAEEVLDKLKTHSIDPQALAEKAAKESNPHTRVFFSLFLRIYGEYDRLLQRDGALDFNDLISQASRLLREHPDIRERYRGRWPHVLVDEYQDVNTPQVDLLKELVGPATRLTCVGDDWQSIYGFRGAEVGHILSFEHDWPDAEVQPLRVNYRNSAAVVELANLSIRRCQAYRDKPSLALRQGRHPVVLHHAGRLSNDGAPWVAARIEELVEEDHYRPEEILILYRKNSNWRLLSERIRALELPVRHDTIHGAKGLEAKVVFLWAVVGGRAGFPGRMRGNRVLNLLSSGEGSRRLDEERRIFYVGLTRALERLYVVTEQHNPSLFVKSLPDSPFQSVHGASAWEDDLPLPCSSCGAELEADWRFCPACFGGLGEISSGK